MLPVHGRGLSCFRSHAVFRRGEGDSAPPPLGLLRLVPREQDPASGARGLCERDRGLGPWAGDIRDSGVVPGRVRVVRGPAGCSSVHQKAA